MVLILPIAQYGLNFLKHVHTKYYIFCHSSFSEGWIRPSKYDRSKHDIKDRHTYRVTCSTLSSPKIPCNENVISFFCVWVPMRKILYLKIIHMFILEFEQTDHKYFLGQPNNLFSSMSENEVLGNISSLAANVDLVSFS